MRKELELVYKRLDDMSKMVTNLVGQVNQLQSVGIHLASENRTAYKTIEFIHETIKSIVNDKESTKYPTKDSIVTELTRIEKLHLQGFDGDRRNKLYKIKILADSNKSPNGNDFDLRSSMVDSVSKGALNSNLINNAMLGIGRNGINMKTLINPQFLMSSPDIESHELGYTRKASSMKRITKVPNSMNLAIQSPDDDASPDNPEKFIFPDGEYFAEEQEEHAKKNRIPDSLSPIAKRTGRCHSHDIEYSPHSMGLDYSPKEFDPPTNPGTKGTKLVGPRIEKRKSFIPPKDITDRVLEVPTDRELKTGKIRSDKDNRRPSKILNESKTFDHKPSASGENKRSSKGSNLDMALKKRESLGSGYRKKSSLSADLQDRKKSVKGHINLLPLQAGFNLVSVPKNHALFDSKSMSLDKLSDIEESLNSSKSDARNKASKKKKAMLKLPTIKKAPNAQTQGQTQQTRQSSEINQKDSPTQKKKDGQSGMLRKKSSKERIKGKEKSKGNNTSSGGGTRQDLKIDLHLPSNLPTQNGSGQQMLGVTVRLFQQGEPDFAPSQPNKKK